MPTPSNCGCHSTSLALTPGLGTHSSQSRSSLSSSPGASWYRPRNPHVSDACHCCVHHRSRSQREAPMLANRWRPTQCCTVAPEFFSTLHAASSVTDRAVHLLSLDRRPHTHEVSSPQTAEKRRPDDQGRGPRAKPRSQQVFHS